MTTDAEKITAVVAELQTDSKKLHDVIHGTNTEDITVDSGDVKTMAKAIKTIGDAGSTAVSKVTNDGSAAVKKVTDDGAAAVSKVTNDGSAAVSKVTNDGATEVGKVKTDGATAVKKVQDDGAAAIAHLKTLSLYLKTDFSNISINDALAKLGLGGLNRGSNALDSYTDNTTLSSISKNSIFSYPTTATDSAKAGSTGIIQTWIINANSSTQISVITSPISDNENAVQYRVKTGGTYGTWKPLGGVAAPTYKVIHTLANIGDSQGSESAGVIDNTGMLLMWGAGSHHQLGQGDDLADKSTAVSPLFPTGAKQVKKIFKSERCCISQHVDNSIFVWGQNTSGCLGAGHSSVIKRPTKLDNSTGVLKDFIIKSVSIWFGNTDNKGKQHCVMLSEGGVIAVCGAGNNGRLGLGNTNNITTFQQLTTTSAVVRQAQAIGGEHGKTYYVSDKIYGTGSNSDNAPLGDGSTTDRLSAVAIHYYRNAQGSISHDHKYQDFVIAYNGTNFTAACTKSPVLSVYGGVYQFGNDDMYLTQPERKKSITYPEFYADMRVDTSWSPSFTAGEKIMFYTKDKTLYYKYSDRNIAFISPQSAPTDKGNHVQAAYSQSFTGKTITKTIFSNNDQIAVLLSDFSIWAMGYNNEGNLGLGDNTKTSGYVSGTLNISDVQHQIIDLAFVGHGIETSLCFLNRGGSYFQTGPVGAHNTFLNDAATNAPVEVKFQ